MRSSRSVVFFVVALVGCLGEPPTPCVECGGACVDLQVDSRNCGSCGQVCAAGSRCEAGACVRTGMTGGTTSCPLDCGPAGRCEADGGSPRCVCAPGRAGDTCERCAPGLQDGDGDGVCLPDCSTLSCSDAGTCESASGTARCQCGVSRAGARCEVCADGYQDNDSDGVCLPSCRLAGLSCGSGACTDTSGVARCTCFPGFADAGCTDCAAGLQDNDGDGVCQPACSASTCGANGTCSDATGRAQCTCAAGYAAPDCRVCASGFQDNDSNGSCLASCATAGLSCGANGTCSDQSGSAQCVCARGYAGPGCAACASGFQDDDGNGACTASCASSPFAPDAGTARLTLRIDNPTGNAFVGGRNVAVDLSTTAARGWALPDGGGLAVVQHFSDGGLQSVPRQLTRLADGGVGQVAFALTGPIAPGSSDRSYAVYRSTSAQNVSGPLPSASSLVVRSDDPTKNLLCDLRGDFFFSIQLRQIGSNQYEINVADGTGDFQAYARITITDTLTGAVLHTANYTNGAGTCCTMVSFIARDTVTITSPSFRVRLETREFSGSRRYFGCELFSTGNPPTSQVGANEFTFVALEGPVTAVTCGE